MIKEALVGLEPINESLWVHLGGWKFNKDSIVGSIRETENGPLSQSLGSYSERRTIFKPNSYSKQYRQADFLRIDNKEDFRIINQTSIIEEHTYQEGTNKEMKVDATRATDSQMIQKGKMYVWIPFLDSPDFWSEEYNMSRTTISREELPESKRIRKVTKTLMRNSKSKPKETDIFISISDKDFPERLPSLKAFLSRYEEGKDI